MKNFFFLKSYGGIHPTGNIGVDSSIITEASRSWFS